MKKIPLTQGQEAIVDDWWFDYLNQWRWRAQWNKVTQSYYAVRLEGKRTAQKAVLMHRVVAQTPDGLQCDHIHHLTLDNREEELRNVTKSQNHMNQRMRKNNPAGVAGISIRPDSGKYRATLRLQGKMVLDKTFSTLEAAVQARLEAEKKYFGEYAYQEE